MYGLREEDVVSAYVHMDESSPHMHFYFIPTYEKRDGTRGISWDKVMPKRMYESQHRDLQARMSAELGEEVHLLTGQSLGVDIDSLTAGQRGLCLELDALREERSDIYQTQYEAEADIKKYEKEVSYYFEQGDVERAEIATQRYNEACEKLPELTHRKKQVNERMREIEEVLADDTHLSANQQTSLELLARVARLQDEVDELKAQKMQVVQEARDETAMEHEKREAEKAQLERFFERKQGELDESRHSIQAEIDRRKNEAIGQVLDAIEEGKEMMLERAETTARDGINAIDGVVTEAEQRQYAREIGDDLDEPDIEI